MRIVVLMPSVLLFCFAPFQGAALAQDDYLPDLNYETPLDAEAVKALFYGKTHKGSYNFKIQNFTGVDFEEFTKADGTVIHKMGDRIDTGTWVLKGRKICFDYDAPDLYGTCLSYFQRGNCVYHYIETQNELLPSRFTAVSVIKGEVPRCDPPMS